ncbi:U-box-domain-containing protein [Coccomyxa subellipsoidea C-169]|uniref:U-box-domain-containing protein n=1 Tax=Coccomyxa subellipsoidea (strain C-169) TaxID=574566 RepID=I0YXH1_COCSC|nr:U-box-domain-containing protein [Coccomyxa subellipsoidea C-169]EIE23090.1 U-box-domain-containing protein [Coccomyxa subellipsoidea C-169]|eukprot:XP_005647634.1 U-box-domain-containing protein [Coccomyxa subellipsoidea C-169]
MGADQAKASSPAHVQRPLDVKDWSCDDVAAWMSSQGWVWRELDQYKARACKIGVTGRTLYDLEVYYSGLLSAPRLTMLWLAVMESSTLQRVHEAAVTRLRWHVDTFIHGRPQKPSQGEEISVAVDGDDDEPDDEYSAKGEFRQMSDASGRAASDQPRTSWIVSAFSNSVLFWLDTLFAPGLQVAFYMSLFYKRHPVALLYVGVVGLCRTAAEGHALLMLFTHPDMTAGEAFSSFICSHLMTPAMNAALAILQVALAPVLPGRVAWLLFWIRCVPLPLLTLWADFAAWVPSSADDGAEPLNGESRTRRHLNRNIVRVRRDNPATVHWPPPLVIPEELEDMEVEVPDVFKCPITLGIMTEPAQTPQGMTYERASIMKWVDVNKHDPCTKAPLRRRHLSPNLALRGVIEIWLTAQGISSPAPAATALPMPVLLPQTSAPAEQRSPTAELPEASAGARAGPQPQPTPPALAPEPATAAASGMRLRGAWLLRQRASAHLQPRDAPVGLRLQSSEILVPGAASALPLLADEAWEASGAAGLTDTEAVRQARAEGSMRSSGSQGAASAGANGDVSSSSAPGISRAPAHGLAGSGDGVADWNSMPAGMTAGNESDSDGRRDRARKRRLNKENVHSPAMSSFISSYMNALTEAQERGSHGMLNAAAGLPAREPSDESQRHE